MIKDDEEWRAGGQAGTVVSNTQNRKTPLHESAIIEDDAFCYYGGFLVAESIPPQFVNLIRIAPAMLRALVKILPIIRAEAERRNKTIGSATFRDHPFWREMADAVDDLDYLISEAQ